MKMILENESGSALTVSAEILHLAKIDETDVELHIEPGMVLLLSNCTKSHQLLDVSGALMRLSNKLLFTALDTEQPEKENEADVDSDWDMGGDSCCLCCENCCLERCCFDFSGPEDERTELVIPASIMKRANLTDSDDVEVICRKGCIEIRKK